VSAGILEQVFFVLKVVSFFFLPPMFIIFPRSSCHLCKSCAVF
jgi:hypothetical protein